MRRCVSLFCMLYAADGHCVFQIRRKGTSLPLRFTNTGAKKIKQFQTYQEKTISAVKMVMVILVKIVFNLSKSATIYK